MGIQEDAYAFIDNNVWGFALSGIVEPIRIQKYGIAGYTRPHSDYDYCTDDQSKITAIVPLVAARQWSGGKLTVAGRCTPRLDRGDCLLFPSFSWHAVSPVTRGERVVLSAWVAGPRLVWQRGMPPKRPQISATSPAAAWLL